MVDLSIIVISYNTKDLTKRCIESIIKSIKYIKLTVEIIIVDNSSTDGTQAQISSLGQDYDGPVTIKTIFNKRNLGFAKANNQAVGKAQGKYILFLNSDVIIDHLDFKKLIEFMEQDEKIGALTVKVLLPNGQVDLACHRGFPTLWRSWCYFVGLEKLFGSIPLVNRLFGGYHLTYKDTDIIHKIDSPSGAFYLTKKALYRKLGGFDERFFMYGEDLDLSYQMKKSGFKIMFYPFEKVTHLKYQSGLKGEDKAHQQKMKNQFYNAMKIFYQKNYSKHYPALINTLVYYLIDIRLK